MQSKYNINQIDNIVKNIQNCVYLFFRIYIKHIFVFYVYGGAFSGGHHHDMSSSASVRQKH